MNWIQRIIIIIALFFMIAALTDGVNTYISGYLTYSIKKASYDLKVMIYRWIVITISAAALFFVFRGIGIQKIKRKNDLLRLKIENEKLKKELSEE